MRKFIQAEKELVDLLPEIGHAGFIVYCVLKGYMNNESRECYPSQEVLAEKCGYNTRQIKRAIKSLEIYGLITVKRQRRAANKYHLNDVSTWGIDDKSLGEDIMMKCPECNWFAVRDKVKHKYICPKCFMDVGKYCREVLKYYYPDIKDRDIFGRPKVEKIRPKTDICGCDDEYYMDRVGRPEEYPLDGKVGYTSWVHVDFATGEMIEEKREYREPKVA